MLPPDPTRRRLRRLHDFEAATGFSARCLRFTNDVAVAHAELASGWRAPPLPGGCRTLGSRLKGFRSHPFSFPGLTLTQAGSMPGARSSPWRIWRRTRVARPRARRKSLSPIAIEVVRRIDALFEIERSINGKSAEERLAVRRTLSQPLVEDLHAYMRAQLAGSPAGTIWSKLSITCSSVGPRSRCSSMTGACACPTMLRNEGSRYRAGKKIVVVLRVRSRWSARRGHVQSHCHGEDE